MRRTKLMYPRNSGAGFEFIGFIFATTDRSNIRFVSSSEHKKGNCVKSHDVCDI